MKEIAIQFIVSAARAMWVDAWGRHVSTTCVWCGKSLNDSGDCRGRNDVRHVSIASTPPHAYLCSGKGPFDCNCGVAGPLDATAVAPPIPQYALFSAAILLGKLEQANGCELVTIVQTASEAEDEGNPLDTPCLHCGHKREYWNLSPSSDHDCVAGAPPPIDLAEFAFAIALEALGHGVSWFDDHERFRIPTGVIDEGGHRRTQPFVVPRIEFEYAMSESGGGIA